MCREFYDGGILGGVNVLVSLDDSGTDFSDDSVWERQSSYDSHYGYTI